MTKYVPTRPLSVAQQDWDAMDEQEKWACVRDLPARKTDTTMIGERFCPRIVLEHPEEFVIRPGLVSAACSECGQTPEPFGFVNGALMWTCGCEQEADEQH
jgi:hypothetical protein